MRKKKTERFDLRHLAPIDRIRVRSVAGPVARIGLTPCIDCLYGKSTWGYPMMSINRRMVNACRVVLEHKLGRPIREGMGALHHCDRPSCVNPDHLYEGNQKDNARDMVERGRCAVGILPVRPGVLCNLSRLNDEAVRVIRFLAKSGVAKQDIATAYGVTVRNVRTIVARQTWKHVEEAA